VKVFGEPKLICISLVMTGTSLVLLPLIHGNGPLHWSAVFHLADKPWIAMLAVLVLLSLGSSLSRAPLFGLLSNLTPATEQGATIGVAQSAGALARIVGPIFAATLYGLNDSTRALPYLICGSIAILAGLADRAPAAGEIIFATARCCAVPTPDCRRIQIPRKIQNPIFKTRSKQASFRRGSVLSESPA
jgi:hypothetical protein